MGYLGVALSLSPVDSVRWQRHTGKHWEYWSELRCGVIYTPQLDQIKGLEKAHRVIDAMQSNAKSESTSTDQSASKLEEREFLGPGYNFSGKGPDNRMHANTREKAHRSFLKWHPRFGLELDSSSKEPVVKKARAAPLHVARRCHAALLLSDVARLLLST